MKYLGFVLILCSFMFGTKQSYAQQIYVGAIGGVNFTNINVKDAQGSDFSTITRFGFGGVAGYEFNKNIALHFEPMFLQKGGMQEANPVTGDNEFKFKISTLELPLFVKLNINAPSVRPYLLAGPSLAFTLNADLEATVADQEFEGDASDIAKDLDFILNFGGGLSIPLKSFSLFVEGRYGLGLSNINKGGSVVLSSGSTSEIITIDDNEVNTRGFQVFAGVTFPL